MEEAESRYRTKLRGYIAPVKQGVKRGLTQAQFDALVDFSYNAGPGKALSGVLDILNSHDALAVDSTVTEMQANNKAKNSAGVMVIQDGLVKRRAATSAAFVAFGSSEWYRYSYVRVPRVWYERAYGER